MNLKTGRQAQKIQQTLFDTDEFTMAGPIDVLTDDARANLEKSFGHAGLSGQEPFLPTDGTTGAEFSYVWCENCAKDDIELDVFCPILAKTAVMEQPKEWMYVGGKACCSEFIYSRP